MGYEKNMNFLVIAKSPQVWKKVDKIGLGSFNCLQLAKLKKYIPYMSLPYMP